MGGCVSKSNRSTCSSRSNGEETSSSFSSSSGLMLDCLFCKRRQGWFSDNVTTLHHLNSIPNRITSNGRSNSSCIFTQQGMKGINQDAMIVWDNFMSQDTAFCGVFDGHGPHGHHVARRVRDALPLKLSAALNSLQSNKNGSCTKCCNEDAKSDVENNVSAEEELAVVYREAFLKSYKAMDKELRSHPNVDCFCSGSTAVTVIKQGSNLFIANIGDSRAIMGSRDSSGSMVAVQLTVDLKPDLPKEAERIKRCKGRVFALQDEPEVQRVWLPFDDAPGLAMARAFGDFCLKGYGVISVPEFSHLILTDRDKFVVLASDGVWDVLDNEEVVEIVSSAPAWSSAARVVVEAAAREWRAKYPTTKMDDCAVVCLFLEEKTDAEPEDQEASRDNNNNNAGSGEEQDSSEPRLRRNFTVRTAEDGGGRNAGSEDEKWSGLEGLTRVNSLVRLLRFSGEKPPP